MAQESRKVVVVGAGSVGTTYIYALMHTGLASEIALIDIDQKKVEGEIMDLCHGLAFVPPVNVHAGSYSDCGDSALIVVTAGAKQAPGQSRTELVKKNAGIVSSICGQIRKSGSSAIVVMVTNPVDALTEVALRQLGRPRETVIGSGTVLDTSRFRYMLSHHCGIDPHNIHAYILGEHGDSEVAAWSMTHVAGMQMDEYCRICHKCDYMVRRAEIAKAVRESAYHIIDYKGATYYAIGLSLVRITQAILRNEHGVLTVSVHMNGEYGTEGISMSVPCVIGRSGVERVIDAQLAPEEQKAFQDSADQLRKVLMSIE